MTISEFLSTLRFFFSPKISLGLSVFEITVLSCQSLPYLNALGNTSSFHLHLCILVELIGGKRRKILKIQEIHSHEAFCSFQRHLLI